MAEQVNVVQSLFGLTPTNVQRQLDAEAEKRAMELASLSRSPVAASEYYGLRGAERFRNAPLFGQNPRVAQAEQLQGVIQSLQQQGVDMATPEGMTQLAGELNKNPEFSGMALALRQQATQMQAAARKTQFEEAKTGSIIAENLAKADQARAGKMSEQMNSRFVDLSIKSRTGTLDKTEKAELESLKELMTIKSPKGQTIDLGGAFNKAFEAADAKAQADEWNRAGASYATAIPLLNQIDRVEQIVPNAFTGKFAEGKLGLSKALGAFGINISDKASDTEYVNAISAKLVQQIARAFPGSLAVKELDQLVKSKPNVAQEASTILRLLGDIRDEIQSQTITYEQLSKVDKPERHKTNPNILQGQNYSKLRRYRDITARAIAGTASVDEAREAMQIKQELGLK